MKKIAVAVGNTTFEAETNDTETASRIIEALPLEGSADVWGNEIYFTTDVRLPLEADAREEVEVGDLAYWPNGPAICVFFGPTPASAGEKPRAYSAVNVFGRIVGDIEPLKKVRQGNPVSLSALD